MRAAPAPPRRARLSTSIARSADGLPHRAMHTLPVSPQSTTPRGREPAGDLSSSAPAEQDAVLGTLDQTPFFALVRAHTIQGTFCDPAYGGNANFVGWDLIGYPGVRLNVTAADQRMAAPAKPIRRSAYDYAMFANTMGVTHGH